MVDINHDGHLDIYVSVGGSYTDPARRANELSVNDGDGTLTDRAGSIFRHQSYAAMGRTWRP